MPAPIGKWKIVFALVCLSGCGNPQFNVPYVAGYPSAQLIHGRIRCELLDMLREKIPASDTFLYRDALIQYHYVIAANLSLDVSQSGSVQPSIAVLDPTRVGLFTLNAGANLQQQQQRSVTALLEYSIDKLMDELSNPTADTSCPDVSAGLAGDLGIRDIVATAMPLPITAKTEGIPAGQFGGTITFTTTANVSGVGPNWSLSRFRGPGGFANLGRVYTNKLTLAFVESKAKPDKTLDLEARAAARDLVIQLQSQDISRQLESFNSRF